MDESMRDVEDICGPDKICQQRWLETQTDCI